MNVEEEIKAHTDLVKKGKNRPDQEECPKCKGNPAFFRLHEKKSRSFWVMVERVVVKMATLLIRWKCPLCNQSFMEYPSWALPYKRYVKETIVNLGCRYAGQEKTTYKTGVLEGNMGYHHEQSEQAIADSQEEKIEPVLARTTLWRWVGFLGAAAELPGKLLEKLKEKEGVSKSLYQGVCEADCKFGHKYRSSARKLVLTTCLKIKTLRDYLGLKRFCTIFSP